MSPRTSSASANSTCSRFKRSARGRTGGPGRGVGASQAGGHRVLRGPRGVGGPRGAHHLRLGIGLTSVSGAVRGIPREGTMEMLEPEMVTTGFELPGYRVVRSLG